MKTTSMNYRLLLYSLALVLSIIIGACSKKDEGIPPIPLIPLSTDFEGKFAFISNSKTTSLPGEIFVLDANGLRQITFNSNSDTHKYYASWIQHGQSILYYDTPICICDNAGTNFVIKSNGSNRTKLPGQPGRSSKTLISPDAKWATVDLYTTTLIFSLDEKLNPILVDSVDGYINGSGSEGWAHDSKSFLIVLQKGQGKVLAIYNLVTKTTTPIFTANLNSGHPFIYDYAWSHDDARVAFRLNGDLYSVNADGTGIQNLTASSKYGGHFSWSKTTDILAYTLRSTDNKADSIILNDFANQSERILQTVADMNGLVNQMQWSSDGSSIAFRFNGDQEGIFVIDADDTNLRQVHDEPEKFDWYTE